MLEYFNKDLRIQEPNTLFMLLILMKFIARGTTDSDVDDRWVVVQRCLNLLILDNALRDKVLSYVVKQWLSRGFRSQEDSGTKMSGWL